MEPGYLGRRRLGILQIVRSDRGAQVVVVRIQIRRMIDRHDAHPSIAADRRIRIPAVVLHDFSEGIAVRNIGQIVIPCAMVVQAFFTPEIDRTLAGACCVDAVVKTSCVRFRRAGRLLIRIPDGYGVAHRALEPMRILVCKRIGALAEGVIIADRHNRRAEAIRRDGNLQSVCAVKGSAFPGADAEAALLNGGHARIARRGRYAAVCHRIVGIAIYCSRRHGLQQDVAFPQILGGACRTIEAGLDRILAFDLADAPRCAPVAGFRICSHRHQAHQ